MMSDRLQTESQSEWKLQYNHGDPIHRRVKSGNINYKMKHILAMETHIEWK